MLKSRSQNGKSGNSRSDKPTCAKSYNKHMGECLVGTGNWYGCGKGVHKVRDCPNVRSQDKWCGQAQASGPSSDSLKRNRFYALCSTREQEESPNVVIGMLLVFSIDVYALLDSGATISFVTSLVAKMIDVLAYILIEPFSATTLVGDSLWIE